MLEIPMAPHLEWLNVIQAICYTSALASYVQAQGILTVTEELGVGSTAGPAADYPKFSGSTTLGRPAKSNPAA
jgi:hypothetical protein